ncbi:MAG: BlaI/MecI/CopY family transcriptional regulator [Oscillibacter sp.]|nr:BlaI/MecI/CopY family transcriptional regulator [Oscillibacter sp.]
MKINLSDSEWKLMNRLWNYTPMTITELTAALRNETGWSKNTIITMLSRLEAKGAVRYEEGRKARQYFPAVEQKDAARAETENFLSKVYGGSFGLMVHAMVESKQLSEADLAELSAILEQAGGAQS